MGPLHTVLLVGVTALVGPAGPAPAKAPLGASGLLGAIPSDAMAVYIGRPVQEGRRSGSAMDWLLTAAQLAAQMGTLPQQGRLLADIGGALPLFGTYPHAIVLLDISAKALRPGSYRLNSLQVAMLFETGGRNEPVAGQIQRMLSGYTNSEFARLTRVCRGQDTYYRLADSRLPPWAVWQWGRLDDLFVIGLGAGAFERIRSAHRRMVRPDASRPAATSSSRPVASQPAACCLADDPWFRKAHRWCQGNTAVIEWTIDFRRIQQRLAEVMRGRPEQVIHAINAQDVHRGLWTVATRGRAIASYSMLRVGQRDVFVPVSDPASFDPAHLAAVPAQAGHYAILQIPVADWIRNIRNGYLASQRPEKRELLRRRWARLERELGIDTDLQLLGHLGEHVVVHTYPPHPLGVPVLCTVLFEIKDEPAAVRATLAALLSACRQYLADLAASRPDAVLVPRLVRREDGIWFVQAGVFIGPALAVTDRWIVLSFSPTAVRANLDHLARVGASGG